MWIFAILLTLSLNWCSSPQFQIFQEISLKLHQKCLTFAPKSKNSSLIQAVVCGSQKQIPNSQQNLLRNSGLIHLIVVSASHLLFIEWLLNATRVPSAIRFLFLIFYAAVTLFQAPVVRALLQMSLNTINTILRLFWTRLEIIFISILLLFALDKDFLDSYSALLSYGAALACSLQGSSLQKNTVAYFILLPLLASLSAPHPLSILLNLIFAPVVGFVAFPLSALNFIFPLTFLSDFFWNTFLLILRGVTFQTIHEPVAIPILYLWIYIFSLNIYMILKEKYERTRALYYPSA